MTKKPTLAQTLALKAAAAVNEAQAAPEPTAADPPAPAPEPKNGTEKPEPTPETQTIKLTAAKRGRPRGRREVASKQTVYLDEARYEALARIAEDRGRSLHSLILEGVDHVIGKPAAPGWKPRD